MIAQVEGELRARTGLWRDPQQKYHHMVCCSWHAWHVPMMPKHAFELLMLAVESFVQISNVNSINAKRSTLMMAVNTCCGVAPAECRAKHSLYDRVMKSTNVSLTADVSPTVKERHVQWTTYRSQCMVR